MSERRVNGKQWCPCNLSFFYRAKHLAGSPIGVCSLSKSFLSSPVVNVLWIKKRLKDCLRSTS